MAFGLPCRGPFAADGVAQIRRRQTGDLYACGVDDDDAAAPLLRNVAELGFGVVKSICAEVGNFS